MSYRFMRLILFFDLPMETSLEKREYRNFRKFLIKNGFLMLQKSVYSRLLLNRTNLNLLEHKVKNNLPNKGLIQTVVITEKQYSQMEYLIGESITDIINTDERFIKL